jgi:hypothetical protein
LTTSKDGLKTLNIHLKTTSLTLDLGGQFISAKYGPRHWFFQKSKEHNPFFNFCTQTFNFAESLGKLEVKHTILNYKYDQNYL